MSWHKIAKEIENNQTSMNKILKDIIKRNKFIIQMFHNNSIPLDRIDTNLTFEFQDLDGKKALSDSKRIVFDNSIFNGKISSKENIHFLIHELYHWLKRQKERAFYLADPEEVEAFILGIAYEIVRGVPNEEIAQIYYPIIEDHFDKDKDAYKMFKALFSSAIKKAKEFQKDT